MEPQETPFDTRAYVENLQQAGFNQTQADGLLNALKQAFRESVATRSDVAAVRSDLSGEIAELRHEIEALGLRTEQQMMDLKVGVNNAIFKILIPTILALTTILGVLIALFGK